jgi:hypothetical protein
MSILNFFRNNRMDGDEVFKGSVQMAMMDADSWSRDNGIVYDWIGFTAETDYIIERSFFHYIQAIKAMPYVPANMKIFTQGQVRSYVRERRLAAWKTLTHDEKEPS